MFKMVFSTNRTSIVQVNRDMTPPQSIKISLTDFRYSMIDRIQYNGGCSSCSRK